MATGSGSTASRRICTGITAKTERVPLRPLLRGGRGRFLAALLLVEFGGAMQGIAYSTVLPVIAGDLGGFALFGATLAAGGIAAVLMLSVSSAVLARLRPAVVLLIATALYLVGVGCTVAAGTMSWVLIGTVVQGIGGGLMGGFAMGAIGAMYDERERPRVFGLFALVWLLPSVVGPGLNAAVTAWAGWRWAIAWPAALVVGGRILMGTQLRTMPDAPRRRVPIRAGGGILLAACLGVGATASALGGWPGRIVFVAACVAGVAGVVLFLVRGTSDRPTARVLLAFSALCATYFGMYELIAVTILRGFDSTLPWSSAAVTASLLGWTLTALRPRRDARPDRPVVGGVLILVAATAMLSIVLGAPNGMAPGLSTAAAVVCGVGMGSAYPLLSSEPFSRRVPPTTVGPLLSFSETGSTAWAVLVVGGLYSSLDDGPPVARSALMMPFVVCVVLAATAVVAIATRPRAGRTPPESAAARRNERRGGS